MVPETETNVTAEHAVTALRRLDIDAKQALIAKLLHDSQCEGLLVLESANFRWLTSGAEVAGLFGPDELPALFFNNQQRWLLSCSVDSQRFFDLELDGMGFQLKEWPWTAHREQFLADLVYGRRIACDRSFRDCKSTDAFFANERRKLSGWELTRLHELGQIVAHAVEATARNIEVGDTEEEVAGHLSHRLWKHGARPCEVSIMSDFRGQSYRRYGTSPDPIKTSATIQATASKFGLHVTAARTVWFGKPDPVHSDAFDAALRWRVVHLAPIRVGDRVADGMAAGQHVLKSSRFEHEGRLSAPLRLTGRESSECLLLPTSPERWAIGWAMVWSERLGSAALGDTYVIGEDAVSCVTVPTDWPLRRIVYQGRTFDLPDAMIRD